MTRYFSAGGEDSLLSPQDSAAAAIHNRKYKSPIGKPLGERYEPDMELKYEATSPSSLQPPPIHGEAFQSYHDGLYSLDYPFSSRANIPPSITDGIAQYAQFMRAQSPQNTTSLTRADILTAGWKNLPSEASSLMCYPSANLIAAQSQPPAWQWQQSPQGRPPSLHIETINQDSDVWTHLGQITPTSSTSKSPHNFGRKGSIDSAPATSPAVNSSVKLCECHKGQNPHITDVGAQPSSKTKRRRKERLVVKKGDVAAEKCRLANDAKRERFLERNRVAASKCRQKKKEWTGNLETKNRELCKEKMQLSVIVASLKDELLYLKGELLKHAGCGCTSIGQYISQEARNVANSKTGTPSALTPKRHEQMVDVDDKVEPVLEDEISRPPSPGSGAHNS